MKYVLFFSFLFGYLAFSSNKQEQFNEQEQQMADCLREIQAILNIKRKYLFAEISRAKNIVCRVGYWPPNSLIWQADYPEEGYCFAYENSPVWKRGDREKLEPVQMTDQEKQTKLNGCRQRLADIKTELGYAEIQELNFYNCIKEEMEARIKQQAFVMIGLPLEGIDCMGKYGSIYGWRVSCDSLRRKGIFIHGKDRPYSEKCQNLSYSQLSDPLYSGG